MPISLTSLKLVSEIGLKYFKVKGLNYDHNRSQLRSLSHCGVGSKKP
jgi:hypothetical protein